MSFWNQDTNNLKNPAAPLVEAGKAPKIAKSENTKPENAKNYTALVETPIAPAQACCQKPAAMPVHSALGEGSVINGKLKFEAPVSIDGKLSGEIVSSAALIVGPRAQIDAKIEVKCLKVSGSVKGVIHATERIELLAGGKLEGEIQTPNLSIEEGAIFNGKCTMPTEKPELRDKKKPAVDSDLEQNRHTTNGLHSPVSV